MKAILFKLLLVLAISPSLGFCNNPSGGLNQIPRKEKRISKTFTVSANDMLKVENSYGNVDITTWDKNTISIEVIIKTSGNDEEKVQQKLDDITIEFKQSSNEVFAKTHFSREESSWWSKLFGGINNVNMEVNYVIKAPVTNNMDINNDYGNIYLDKLEGDAHLNCDYGSLDIGELHGENNHLNFDYSRNTHVGYVKKATINADYSEFTIDDAISVDLQADYTDSKFKKVELLQFNCDYGSLSVDKVKKITGNGDYLGTSIGQVYQQADLRMDYGNVSIDKIMKGAGNIKLNTDYTGIKIGYAHDQPFRFDIQTSYSGVSGLDNFEINKQNQSSSSKSYLGYHLQDSGNSSININASYGNVSFQQK